MSSGMRIGAGIVGFALIGIYSWIMMATDGNGGWAWLLLVAGIVLLVWTARAASRGRSDPGA